MKSKVLILAMFFLLPLLDVAKDATPSGAESGYYASEECV